MNNLRTAIIWILLLAGNIFTIVYFFWQVRRRTLTRLKLSICLTLAYSLTIPSAICIAMTMGNGIGPKELGFLLFVFVTHVLIGFPISYFLSKPLFGKYLVK
jgi:hypothetical protein